MCFDNSVNQLKRIYSAADKNQPDEQIRMIESLAKAVLEECVGQETDCIIVEKELEKTKFFRALPYPHECSRTEMRQIWHQ